MSDVNNNSLQGDATVGRHLTVGGDATVNGNARIKRGLRVDGFLEAPNLIGCHKGYFPSAEALLDAYPRPQRGWWALVGDVEEATPTIYAEQSGAWYDTGKSANIQVPGQVYEDAIDQFSDRIIQLGEANRSNEDNILRVEAQLEESINTLRGSQETTIAKVTENTSEINRIGWSLHDHIEEPGGFRDLDTDVRNGIEPRLEAAEAALAATKETADEAYDMAYNHIEETHQELQSTITGLNNSITSLERTLAAVQAQAQQAVSLAGNAAGTNDLQNLEESLNESMEAIQRELTSVQSGLNQIGPLAIEAYRVAQDLPDLSAYKRVKEMAEDCTNTLEELEKVVNATKGDVEQLFNELPVVDLGDLPSRVSAVECDVRSHGTTINSALRNSTEAISQANAAQDAAGFVASELNRLASTLSARLTEVQAIAQQAQLGCLAAKDAIDCFRSWKGQPEGYATLDKTGCVPVEQIPLCVQDEVHNAVALASEAKSIAREAGNAAQSAENFTSLAEKCAKSAETVSSEALEHVHELRDVLDAVSDNVGDMRQELDQLQPEVERMGKQLEELPTFLPINGQLSLDDDEPASGVWLIDNGEGGVMFASYGDTDWYGHAEEEYNSDSQFIPGQIYRMNGQLATIRNDKLQIIGSHLAGYDPDVVVTPGLYMLTSGEPLFVSRTPHSHSGIFSYTQVMLTEDGLQTRTGSAPIPNVGDPSEVEWDEWEELSGGVPAGAIITDEDPDDITEPNTYLVNGKDAIIVSKTTDPQTHLAVPSQIRVTSKDIKTRARIQGEWEPWSDLTSVEQAKILAEQAKGAIATTDDPDELTSPNVYTRQDGTLIIVTVNGSTITQYGIGNGEIDVRSKNAGEAWTSWRPLGPIRVLNEIIGYMADDINKIMEDGVYVAAYDFNFDRPCLSTLAKWTEFANTHGCVADGVAVVKGGKILVIALDEAEFEADNTILQSYDWECAIVEWNGQLTTAYHASAGNQIAEWAASHDNQSLIQEWWLPSLAELLFIYSYKDKIDHALMTLGLSPIGDKCYWTCTSVDADSYCAVDMGSGEIRVKNPNQTLFARPVSSLLYKIYI